MLFILFTSLTGMLFILFTSIPVKDVNKINSIPVKDVNKINSIPVKDVNKINSIPVKDLYRDIAFLSFSDSCIFGLHDTEDYCSTGFCPTFQIFVVWIELLLFVLFTSLTGMLFILLTFLTGMLFILFTQLSLNDRKAISRYKTFRRLTRILQYG
jgi:hypothetical protein